MPTYLIQRCYVTLYMSTMDVGSSLKWSTASTITSWNHFHSTVTKYYQNLTQLWQRTNVRVHLYAYIPIERGKNTLYMSYVDVGSNQRWTTGSTMTSWHHFYLTVTQNCYKLTRPQWCNSVRVHWYAYLPHWKVLKHFIHIYLYVRSNWRWSTPSTMTSWYHIHPTVTQNC